MLAPLGLQDLATRDTWCLSQWLCERLLSSEPADVNSLCLGLSWWLWVGLWSVSLELAPAAVLWVAAGGLGWLPGPFLVSP